MASAIRSALKEMCHIELAYEVIAAKRLERGNAGLNDADRRHLRRATELQEGCVLLHAEGAPPRHQPFAEAAPPWLVLLR